MANVNNRHRDEDDHFHEWRMRQVRIAAVAYNDFQFAYRLQLEEALQASRDAQQSSTRDDKLAVQPSENVFLSSALHNLTLSGAHQQTSGSCSTIHETERFEDPRPRDPDSTFVMDLHNVNKSETEVNHSCLNDKDDLYKGSSKSDLNDTAKSICEDASPHAFKVYVTSLPSSDESPLLGGIIGAIVMDSQNIAAKKIRKLLSLGVGKPTADYMALIAGLEAAFSMGVRHVEAFTDSLLVFNQVTRRWKVHSYKLRALRTQVMQLAQKFKQFHLNVVPLNENRHALMLAREVCYFRNAPETEKVMKVPEMKGYCPICMEWKKKVEMFEVSQCRHGFCLSCIIQHVEVKVQAAQVPVRCPQENCSQTLSLSQCQSFLSQKWFDLLKKRIIEASMPESERVYCPRPKCSALMHRKDLLASREGTSSLSSFTFVAPSKCVECSGLFCIDCLVPWHAFMSCEQYQRLPMFFRGSEDILLYKLAEKQKWQRCGNCRQMIELKDGCYHITCRCGHEFCYLCGKAWKSKKQTCQCRLWDEDFLFEEPLDQSEDEEHDEWEGSVGSEDDSEDEHDQVAESEDESEYWEDLSDLNTRVRFEVPASFYNPYYKTKLCWHWETGCPWGDYCKFAHGTKELRRVNFFQPIF